MTTEPIERILDSFQEIESRLAGVDNDGLVFLKDHLTEAESEECKSYPKKFMDLDEIKSHSESTHKAYLDIPHLPLVSYEDSELKLWSAIIYNYRQVATTVPKYTSVMVRSGIPPSLRGIVWKSISEASSTTFASLYDSLAAEWTPFVKVIGRDLNRTFPEIGLFEESGGEGQQMLGRVLRAYSAYDMQVGYCQGLTFLAGPLLLHMSDKDAFCVLVRLMEDYDLRSMFKADMEGLRLRMYQFECLFESYLPEVSNHFNVLGVNSIFVSQWFLSFYAVTCPLSMLVRIYDLMLAEGAIATLMRIGLVVLQRNQTFLLDCDEEEQILQHLLGRCLWDCYGFDGDLLISDISASPSSVLTDLKNLEQNYKVGDGKVKRSKSRSTQSDKFLASKFPFSISWAGPSLPFQRAFSRSFSVQQTSLHRSDSKASVSSLVSATTLSSTTGQLSPRTLSSSSSISSYATLEPSESQKKVDQLELELNRLKGALEMERKERQIDREEIVALLHLVSKLAEQEDDDDALKSAISAIKTRLAITDDNVQQQSLNSCQSCDRYLMDLATAKANEAMARQEIDELNDKIYSLTTELKGTKRQAAPTNTTSGSRAFPSLYPPPPANNNVPKTNTKQVQHARSWSIWR